MLNCNQIGLGISTAMLFRLTESSNMIRTRNLSPGWGQSNGSNILILITTGVSLSSCLWMKIIGQEFLSERCNDALSLVKYQTSQSRSLVSKPIPKLKIAWIVFSDSPTHLLFTTDGLTTKNRKPISFATARAIIVLPHPGGLVIWDQILGQIQDYSLAGNKRTFSIWVHPIENQISRVFFEFFESESDFKGDSSGIVFKISSTESNAWLMNFMIPNLKSH